MTVSSASPTGKAAMKKNLACVAAALLLGGCASPEATTIPESPTTREYPTGSNIPRKNRDPKAEGVSVYSPEELERLQNRGMGIPERSRGGP